MRNTFEKKEAGGCWQNAVFVKKSDGLYGKIMQAEVMQQNMNGTKF